MSSNRRASMVVNSLRRSPRRSRTKTPSVNELSSKFKVSPRGKRRLEFRQEKPLKGRTFYLDLQGYRRTNTLQAQIKQLGGTVEEFLSKDISFVVTTRKDADNRCSPRSCSTPSPSMSVPSPYPGNVKSSSAKGSAVPSPLSADSSCSAEQMGQPAPKHDTRGKALAKQAAIKYRYGTSNVITTARNWGVQIMSLEELFEKLEQYGSVEKKSSIKPLVSEKVVKQGVRAKARVLNAPFIKIEDHSRSYKPLVHELKEWPKIYFDGPLGGCPFDSPKKHLGNDEGEHFKDKRKQMQEDKNRKKGFCECCCVHYEELDLHLRSDRHQSFAKDQSNYRSLDEVISRGPSLKDLLSKMIAEDKKIAKEEKEHDRGECKVHGASSEGTDKETPAKQSQPGKTDSCHTPDDNLTKEGFCVTPIGHALGEWLHEENTHIRVTPIVHALGEGLHEENTRIRVTRSRLSAGKPEGKSPHKGGECQELRRSPRTSSSLKKTSDIGKNPGLDGSAPIEEDKRSTGSEGVTPQTRSRQRSATGSPVNKQLLPQPQENSTNHLIHDTVITVKEELSPSQTSEKHLKKNNQDEINAGTRSGSPGENSDFDPSVGKPKNNALTCDEAHVGRPRLRSTAARSVKETEEGMNSVEKVTRSRLHVPSDAMYNDNKVEGEDVTDASTGAARDVKVERATRSRAQSAVEPLRFTSGTRDSSQKVLTGKGNGDDGTMRSRLRASPSSKKQMKSEGAPNNSGKSSPSNGAGRQRKVPFHNVKDFTTEKVEQKKLRAEIQSQDETNLRTATHGYEENVSESLNSIDQEKTNDNLAEEISRDPESVPMVQPSAFKIKLSDCRRSAALLRPVLEADSDDTTTESLRLSSKGTSSERTLSDGNDDGDNDISFTPTLEGNPSSPRSVESGYSGQTVPRTYNLRQRTEPEDQDPPKLRKSVSSRRVRKGKPTRRNTVTNAFTSVKSKTRGAQIHRTKWSGSSTSSALDKQHKDRRGKKIPMTKTLQTGSACGKDCTSESGSTVISASPRSESCYEESANGDSSLRLALQKLEDSDNLDTTTSEQNCKASVDDAMGRFTDSASDFDTSTTALCGSPLVSGDNDRVMRKASRAPFRLLNSQRRKHATSGDNTVTAHSSQLFDSDSENDDFYGFDVPQFDCSFSSEGDLGCRINSILESMGNADERMKNVTFQQTDDIKRTDRKIVPNRNKNHTQAAWSASDIDRAESCTERNGEALAAESKNGPKKLRLRSEDSMAGAGEATTRTKIIKFGTHSPSTRDSEDDDDNDDDDDDDDDDNDDDDDDVFSTVAGSSDDEEDVAASPFSVTCWRQKRKSEDLYGEVKRPAKRRKSSEQGSYPQRNDQFEHSAKSRVTSVLQTAIKDKTSDDNCTLGERPSFITKVDEQLDVQQVDVIYETKKNREESRKAACSGDSTLGNRLDEINVSSESHVDTFSSIFTEYDTSEPVFETLEERVKLRRIKKKCESQGNDAVCSSVVYNNSTNKTRKSAWSASEERETKLPPLRKQTQSLNRLKPVQQDSPTRQRMSLRSRLNITPAQLPLAKTSSSRGKATRNSDNVESSAYRDTPLGSRVNANTSESPLATTFGARRKVTRTTDVSKSASRQGTSLRSRVNSAPTQPPLAMSSGTRHKASWIYDMTEFSSPSSSSPQSSNPAAKKKRHIVGTFKRVNQAPNNSRLTRYSSEFSKENDVFAFRE